MVNFHPRPPITILVEGSPPPPLSPLWFFYHSRGCGWNTQWIKFTRRGKNDISSGCYKQGWTSNRGWPWCNKVNHCIRWHPYNTLGGCWRHQTPTSWKLSKTCAKTGRYGRVLVGSLQGIENTQWPQETFIKFHYSQCYCMCWRWCGPW